MSSSIKAEYWIKAIRQNQIEIKEAQDRLLRAKTPQDAIEIKMRIARLQKEIAEAASAVIALMTELQGGKVK